MTSKQDQQPQTQTAIRLPDPLLERLDKLAEKMSRPAMRMTRAVVLRLAVHHGVEYLEAELKKR